MDKQLISRMHKTFEERAHEKNGVEFWLARDLQRLLEYDEWRNFSTVITKAKTACVTSGQALADHFVDVNKTITLPKGATRDVDDVVLTRYACYLIAQNGDPRKEAIAFAQSYFAVQTRKQELVEEIVISYSKKSADIET
jgi:DNA-damage-inducible protein D